MGVERARLFPKRSVCPGLGMKIPNSDACSDIAHNCSRSRQIASAFADLNHRSAFDRIRLQRVERAVGFLQLKNLHVALNRNLSGNPQKVLPIFARVVGNAAHHTFLVKQIVVEARKSGSCESRPEQRIRLCAEFSAPPERSLQLAQKQSPHRAVAAEYQTYPRPTLRQAPSPAVGAAHRESAHKLPPSNAAQLE